VGVLGCERDEAALVDGGGLLHGGTLDITLLLESLV